MIKSWMAVLPAAFAAASVSASIEDPSFENDRTPYKITRMKTALEPIKEEAVDERYVCRIEDSLSHSGKKSLFFSTTNPAGRNYLSFAELPCEAHREYEFSIWYRMEDVRPGGRLWCEYWCYDRNGQYLQHVNGSSHNSTPGKWHQFRLRFFPVKNSRFCKVTLKFCGPMKVWVDDAVLRHPCHGTDRDRAERLFHGARRNGASGRAL